MYKYITQSTVSLIRTFGYQFNSIYILFIFCRIKPHVQRFVVICAFALSSTKVSTIFPSITYQEKHIIKPIFVISTQVSRIYIFRYKHKITITIRKEKIDCIKSMHKVHPRQTFQHCY